MQAFHYKAYTPEGQRRSGTLVAESERAASQSLRDAGLLLEMIDARAPTGSQQRWSTRLDHSRQGLFLRQMAVLLSAEMSVDQALSAVQAGADTRALAGFCARLKAATLGGAPLSNALAEARVGFPPAYAAALRAGERAGDLATVLDRLATYHDAQGDSRAEIATALIYPGIVAAVSLLVCALLVTHVAPELVALFETNGQDLPGITRAVLAVAHWMGAYHLAVLGAFAIGTGAAAVVLSRADWRGAVLDTARRLPLFGPVLTLRLAAAYLRTLALVLNARQTPLEAVSCAMDVLPQPTLRAGGEAAVQALREGERLGQALQHIDVLPPMARHLIEAGEASARLAEMTDRAAHVVEAVLARRRSRLAAALDPILMLCVGSLVLIVVLAVLLPIFDLQGAMPM